MLASCSTDGTVKLWDVATGKELRTLAGHTNQVLSVAFSPDGNWLASGSSDNTIKLWDVATGEELRTFRSHTKWVWSVAFSPDGRWLASGSDAGVKIWNLATGEELRTLDGHRPVAFSPDGRWLAAPVLTVLPDTGRLDSKIMVWKTDDIKALIRKEGAK